MRRVPVDSSLMKRSAYAAKPEEGDDLVGLRALGPLEPTRPWEPQRHRRSDPRARPGSSATSTVSRTVRSANSRALLEGTPEPERGTRGPAQARHVAPLEDHGAVARQEPADGVHQGRLPRTVRADQPDGLLCTDLQVDVVDHHSALPKLHAELSHLERDAASAAATRRGVRRLPVATATRGGASAGGSFRPNHPKRRSRVL